MSILLITECNPLNTINLTLKLFCLNQTTCIRPLTICKTVPHIPFGANTLTILLNILHILICNGPIFHLGYIFFKFKIHQNFTKLIANELSQGYVLIIDYNLLRGITEFILLEIQPIIFKIFINFFNLECFQIILMHSTFMAHECFWLMKPYVAIL